MCDYTEENGSDSSSPFVSGVLVEKRTENRVDVTVDVVLVIASFSGWNNTLESGEKVFAVNGLGFLPFLFLRGRLPIFEIFSDFHPKGRVSSPEEHFQIKCFVVQDRFDDVQARVMRHND